MLSCLDCVSYVPLRVPSDVGNPMHLCSLPRECAPPPLAEDDADRYDDEDGQGRTYLGTSCDRMRYREALCGPRGRMWQAAPAGETVR